MPKKVFLRETLRDWDMETLYKIATVLVDFLISKCNYELKSFFKIDGTVA